MNQDLKLKIEQECLRYHHYIQGDFDEAKTLINNLAEQVSRLTYKDIVVELTPSNSIKFIILRYDEAIVTISKPLGIVEDLEKDEIISTFRVANGDVLACSIYKIEDLLVDWNLENWGGL